MKLRRLVAVLVLIALGMGPFWSGGAPAIAQDGDVPAAAIVAGTCNAPGDEVAALRDLTVRDGGEVLVSVTTIDVEIADLLGADHAVVLTDGGDVVACGETSGDADDVYVGVAATTDAGWGGVAWLHAREDRTQVSLFVEQNLSGGGGETPPTASPTEEPNGPPDEETPSATAGATRTPAANVTPTPGEEDETPTPGGGTGTETPEGQTTYTSPSFGYSVAYDGDFWDAEDESRPTNDGPLDILSLSHSYYTTADFVGEPGRPNVNALDLCEVRLGQYESDAVYSNINIREEIDGDENEASVAFDYTYTNDAGESYNWTNWIGCYHAPDDSVLMTFWFTTTPGGYNRQVPLREALQAGLTFPGE